MSKLGGECVFASEIDAHARKTYLHNFDINEKDFNQDITKMNIKKIPEFDVLCAGFPCQPFSQAGKKRGFNDHRGNLFFNIADILNEKQPNAFFLENVRGIKSHDDGNTFASIKDIIENRLGYSFYSKIIKASDFGLPQLRPRTFMVGFKNDEDKTFEFPLYKIGGGGDESKIYWFAQIAELPVQNYLTSDSSFPHANFYENTMLGKMIPFNPEVYYNPQTGENSLTFSPGFVEISTKKIKYNSDTDPVKLVYASPSLTNDEEGPIIFVLVYEVNKNYIP